jgi:hypothetical protein
LAWSAASGIARRQIWIDIIPSFFMISKICDMVDFAYVLRLTAPMRFTIMTLAQQAVLDLTHFHEVSLMFILSHFVTDKAEFAVLATPSQV